MEFKNLTPFPALAFDGLDQRDIRFHTVVMRLTFHLQDDGTLGLAPEQTPLVTTDEYYGELNQSSVRQESDFAPYKPHTDVIVNATAHAPSGKPTRHFDVRLLLRSTNKPAPLPEPPRGLNPLQAPSDKEVANWQRAVSYAQSHPIAGAVLIDKTLTLSGERWFRKKAWPFRLFWWTVKWASLGIIRRNPWKLTAPQKLATLPLRYEYAYGGDNKILVTDHAAHRVKKKDRLPQTAQADSAQETPAIAHSAYPQNTVGRGFAAPWYLRATRCKRIPAPQIAAPNERMGRFGQAYTPRGLGILCRAWQPRLPLAGAFDQAWLDQRHPYLPADFDFAYWNAAPRDQQIAPHLDGDESITLTNLCPPATPGATRDHTGNTELTLTLPGHLPFVLVRFEDGRLGELAAKLDTLIIDTLPDRDNPEHRPSVVCVWRATVASEPAVRVLEARMIAKADVDAMREEAKAKAATASHSLNPA